MRCKNIGRNHYQGRVWRRPYHAVAWTLGASAAVFPEDAAREGDYEIALPETEDFLAIFRLLPTSWLLDQNGRKVPQSKIGGLRAPESTGEIFPCRVGSNKREGDAESAQGAKVE